MPDKGINRAGDNANRDMKDVKSDETPTQATKSIIQVSKYHQSGYNYEH